MKSLHPASTTNYEHEDMLNILVHKSHKESRAALNPGESQS